MSPAPPPCAAAPRTSPTSPSRTCAANTVDHLGIGTFDAPAYAIARDALDNPGPANLERVDAAVCNEPLMPDVDPATFPTSMLDAGVFLGTTIVTSERVPEEPELACYVSSTCPRPPPALAARARNHPPSSSSSAPGGLRRSRYMPMGMAPAHSSTASVVLTNASGTEARKKKTGESEPVLPQR